MAIDYQTREWKDDQTGGTPIDAANLNRMEQGIANACAGVDGIKSAGGVSADMIADGSISESKLSEDLRDFVSQPVLWEGSASEGDIQVPGLSDSSLVLIEVSSSTADTAGEVSMVCSISTSGQLSGSTCTVVNDQDLRTFAILGTVEGDTLKNGWACAAFFNNASGSFDRLAHRKIYRVQKLA